MSLRKRLRVLLVCSVLQMGALAGVPMRPDEIQELLNQMNQPKLAHVVREEDEKGNDPLDDEFLKPVE